MKIFNPILNNPYEEPQHHYATDENGNLEHEVICLGRRPFESMKTPMLTKSWRTEQIFDSPDEAQEFKYLINLVRKEVNTWLNQNYIGTTRVTKELLTYWFDNPERHNRLFFVQREAIETAIWLNEVAPTTNPGTYLLSRLREATANEQLPRIAFKMATGTGKTVVMAGLILYHYFNREEYRNDTRFADNFLIIAPSVTIRDRLAVLLPDATPHNAQARDYYRQRDLVPAHWQDKLKNLPAKLVITNYHTFEPRNLQGNKRSPLDGKLGAETPKEDVNQIIRRTLGGFRLKSRLLVLNDEAHHCYQPKPKDEKRAGKQKTTLRKPKLGGPPYGSTALLKWPNASSSSRSMT
jgi:type III restriction enzyme